MNYFKDAKSTSIEVMAGLTTFITMSYIIFLQPQIMSGKLFGMETGMDFGALLTGTCLVAAFGSILMGLLANYPIALAPGMGENFFFVLTVLPVCVSLTSPTEGWKLALGVVFLSGVIFAILSFLNVRKIIMESVSPSSRHAIAAGIGVFIALIGLENVGLIVSQSGHYVLNGDLKTAAMAVFLIGLIVTAALHVLKIRGAILIGILSGTLTALVLGQTTLRFPFSAPPSVAPIFAKVDVIGVFKHLPKLIPLIVIFTFMDMFDTLGTLIGVGSEAGLLKDGQLPRARRAFASDAIATVAGTIGGHSTVTAYIESATGVEYGGRTGLTAVTTGLLFLLALFCAPFVRMVADCKAITAPALVIVGAMMLRSAGKIDWDDYSELIPAFLILIGIPFTFNIGDGIILGFIAYPIIKLASGKHRDLTWVNITLGAILILYLVFIKS